MTKLFDITGKAVAGEWGKDDEVGNGIPVLRTTNFTNEGIVNYDDVVTRTITKKNIEEKYLRPGDIIIEKSGGSDKQPVGRVIYFDGPEHKYLFNNFTGLLRVKDQEKWIPKYIFYSLFAAYRQGKTRRFENKTTGLHNLQTDSYIKSFEIKDSSINIQKKVCVILDNLRDQITLYKQELQKLDELTKARFVEMFGDLVQNDMNWNFDKLGNLCDVRDGTHDSPVYQTKGYPLLTSKNFTSGEVDFSDAKLISKSDFDKINKRSKVDEGDIIMPMIGTIGSPVIVNTSVPFAIKNVALIKFNDNSPLNIFIKGVLESDYFARKIQEKNRGNTQKFISLKDIRELRIPVVPYDKQKCFENFLCHVDKSKSEIQKSLDKTQLLFDSLMQEYFS
jgi:type I restriction enzyme S subunit